jgi:hypothetical protein
VAELRAGRASSPTCSRVWLTQSQDRLQALDESCSGVVYLVKLALRLDAGRIMAGVTADDLPAAQDIDRNWVACRSASTVTLAATC